VTPLLSDLTADRCLLFITTGFIYRPSRRHLPSAVLVALLLLVGDIETNPGPPTVSTTSSGIALGLLNASLPSSSGTPSLPGHSTSVSCQRSRYWRHSSLCGRPCTSASSASTDRPAPSHSCFASSSLMYWTSSSLPSSGSSSVTTSNCPGVGGRQLDVSLEDLLQPCDLTQHVVELLAVTTFSTRC